MTTSGVHQTLLTNHNHPLDKDLNTSTSSELKAQTIFDNTQWIYEVSKKGELLLLQKTNEELENKIKSLSAQLTISRENEKKLMAENLMFKDQLLVKENKMTTQTSLSQDILGLKHNLNILKADIEALYVNVPNLFPLDKEQSDNQDFVIQFSNFRKKLISFKQKSADYLCFFSSLHPPFAQAMQERNVLAIDYAFNRLMLNETDQDIDYLELLCTYYQQVAELSELARGFKENFDNFVKNDCIDQEEAQNIRNTIPTYIEEYKSIDLIVKEVYQKKSEFKKHNLLKKNIECFKESFEDIKTYKAPFHIIKENSNLSNIKMLFFKLENSINHIKQKEFRPSEKNYLPLYTKFRDWLCLHWNNTITIIKHYEARIILLKNRNIIHLIQGTTDALSNAEMKNLIVIWREQADFLRKCHKKYYRLSEGYILETALLEDKIADTKGEGPLKKELEEYAFHDSITKENVIKTLIQNYSELKDLITNQKAMVDQSWIALLAVVDRTATALDNLEYIAEKKNLITWALSNKSPYRVFYEQLKTKPVL